MDEVGPSVFVVVGEFGGIVSETSSPPRKSTQPEPASARLSKTIARTPPVQPRWKIEFIRFDQITPGEMPPPTSTEFPLLGAPPEVGDEPPKPVIPLVIASLGMSTSVSVTDESGEPEPLFETIW